MRLIVLERNQWRAAAIEINNEFTDIWAETVTNRKPSQGDIILGKVSSVLDGKNAAFISLGSGKPGLLNGEELVLAQGKKTAGEPLPAVSDCVQEGQSILVQVKHPGVDRKGPIVTELIKLTLDHLVYMPYGGYSAVSKQLTTNREELLQFADKHCIEQEGVIFRTSAGYIKEEALLAELQSHRKEWLRILEQSSTQRAPSMVKKNSGLGEEVSKLYPLHRVSSLAANSSEAVSSFFPLLSKNATLMELNEKKKKLDKLEDTILNMKKTIKMGKANLHIEETHALTAIDVDTGGVKLGTKNETHFEVNRLAVDEIAKQLRLRNISGMIVVDFLRVEKEEQQNLHALMKSKEETDKRLKVGGFTKLGLFEMQRKKSGLPLSHFV